MSIVRSRFSVFQVFHQPALLLGTSYFGAEGSWREQVMNASIPLGSHERLQLPWSFQSERRAWASWMSPKKPPTLERSINESFVNRAIQALLPLRLGLVTRKFGAWGAECFVSQFAIAIVITKDIETTTPRSLKDDAAQVRMELGGSDPFLASCHKHAVGRLRAKGLSVPSGTPTRPWRRFSLYSVIEAAGQMAELNQPGLAAVLHQLAGVDRPPAYPLESFLVGGPSGYHKDTRTRSSRLDLYHFQTAEGLALIDQESARRVPSLPEYGTSWQHRYQLIRLLASSMSAGLVLDGELGSSVHTARRKNAEDLLRNQIIDSAQTTYGRHVARIVSLRSLGLPPTLRISTTAPDPYDLRVQVDLRTDQ